MTRQRSRPAGCRKGRRPDLAGLPNRAAAEGGRRRSPRGFTYVLKLGACGPHRMKLLNAPVSTAQPPVGADQWMDLVARRRGAAASGPTISSTMAAATAPYADGPATFHVAATTKR